MEFATICHVLGAQVTLVDRGTRLLTMMDEEISRTLEDLFKSWGVALLFGSTVESVAPHGDDLAVRLSTGETHVVDTLLFAAGRLANTQDLGLEAAGVALDSRGRIGWTTISRTSRASVYAPGGRCAARPTLASIAMEQGRVAVCHAFGIPF